jgi:hypothetical protein
MASMFGTARLPSSATYSMDSPARMNPFSRSPSGLCRIPTRLRTFSPQYGASACHPAWR